jgi:two-component system copper resistance phosphate regulon response regulator CusR
MSTAEAIPLIKGSTPLTSVKTPETKPASQLAAFEAPLTSPLARRGESHALQDCISTNPQRTIITVMRVLVVEDEKKIAAFIKQGLVEQGYSVDVAGSGSAAETMAADSEYDLIILDVLLPDQNGMDTARHLRQDGYQGPILMLTALTSTKDRVNGLDAGADDYLAKPFAFDELTARIRALLRRSQNQGRGASNVLRFQDLELDLLSRKAKRGSREITLTQKEFALLEYFMRNVGRVLSRTQIAEHVWDVHYDTGSNVIDVYVTNLRKKLISANEHKLIHTVVGVGYVLKDE